MNKKILEKTFELKDSKIIGGISTSRECRGATAAGSGNCEGGVTDVHMSWYDDDGNLETEVTVCNTDGGIQ